MKFYKKALLYDYLLEAFNDSDTVGMFVANLVSNPLGDTILPFTQSVYDVLKNFSFINAIKYSNKIKSPMLRVSVNLDKLNDDLMFSKYIDERIFQVSRALNSNILAQKEALLKQDFELLQRLIDEEGELAELYLDYNKDENKKRAS